VGILVSGSTHQLKLIRRMMMNDKDPVMVDLDRYLTELEEDYVDPADAARERAEYLADQED
jgi:hypothetical protein